VSISFSLITKINVVENIVEFDIKRIRPFVPIDVEILISGENILDKIVLSWPILIVISLFSSFVLIILPLIISSKHSNNLLTGKLIRSLK
jgi:hypothetical protein